MGWIAIGFSGLPNSSPTIMKWIKRGRIFKTSGEHPWMKTHAQVPTADLLPSNILRVYIGVRDSDNRTHTTYVEVEQDNPQNVVYVHDEPVLPLGRTGTFDDCGVMPSWILSHDGKKYLYYLGWNRASTVPYRVANGLAISTDGGRTFTKVSEGPIMDRSVTDPLAVSTQCVLFDEGTWKSWYMSFTEWFEAPTGMEPLYHIRYASSQDGIRWKTNGEVCIDYKSRAEGGIARPCVLKEDGKYKMWYSYRGYTNYRNSGPSSYRIGYAESHDGINWERMDDEVGIDVSSTGWDSKMIAYPYIYDVGGTRYLLYNGNGFGESGFGYAVLER